MSILVLASLLLCAVRASLKVQSNEKLFEKLRFKGEDSEVIAYSLAHFGVVPYGATLLGYVHFDPLNEFGCKKTRLEPYSPDDLQPVLLVRRGNCEFVDKARNAQYMGAAMLLIANDKEEDLSKVSAIALHDGSRAKIPTLIIPMLDGQAMLEVLMDADKATAQSVVVQFTMNVPKAPGVEVTTVLGIGDSKGFTFLGSFKDMAEDLDPKLFRLTFVHYFDTCEGCSPDLLDKHCLDKEGRFCLFTFDSGKTAFKALLLQKCALANVQFKSNFLAYSERYAEDCLSQSRLSAETMYDCASRIAKAFVPSNFDRVERCLQNALLSPATVLAEDQRLIREGKVKEFPLVIVNNQTIDGSLSSDNIFQAVCFAFTTPPPACAFIRGKYIYSKTMNDLVQNTRKSEKRFLFFNAIVAGLVFALAAFLFYYIFKRTYKRMISTQIDAMIKDSIAKYKRVHNDTELEP